jgi:hypothetical protein
MPTDNAAIVPVFSNAREKLATDYIDWKFYHRHHVRTGLQRSRVADLV